MIRFEIQIPSQEAVREIVKLAWRVHDQVFLDNGDQCKVDAKDFLGVMYAASFSKVFISSYSEDIIRVFMKYTKM